MAMWYEKARDELISMYSFSNNISVYNCYRVPFKLFIGFNGQEMPLTQLEDISLNVKKVSRKYGLEEVIMCGTPSEFVDSLTLEKLNSLDISSESLKHFGVFINFKKLRRSKLMYKILSSYK